MKLIQHDEYLRFLKKSLNIRFDLQLKSRAGCLSASGQRTSYLHLTIVYRVAIHTNSDTSRDRFIMPQFSYTKWSWKSWMCIQRTWCVKTRFKIMNTIAPARNHSVMWPAPYLKCHTLRIRLADHRQNDREPITTELSSGLPRIKLSVACKD